MILTSQDARDVKTYLRAKEMDIEDLAGELNVHRTTISKKLNNATEISPMDLLEWGIKIGQRDAQMRGQN